MPTYDYLCEACNHEFELFQSIKDGAKRKCPECGRQKLRRLIGPGAAIVFKGSGFYQTDYRSESYKKAAAADKPADKSADTADKPKGAADKPAPSSAASDGAGKSKDKDKGKNK